MKKIVIIGSGINGLVASNYLAKKIMMLQLLIKIHILGVLALKTL